MATASATKTTKPRAKRKAKYVVLYSPFLMRETKHELIGEPMETDNGRQQWAKCSVSHHSQLINLDTLQAASAKPEVSINREDAIDYSPKSEYKVGDTIYHRTWDDVGVVRAKEIMSNGHASLVVLFEKNKEKRLVENIK
jgi:hypothetical protein